MVEYKKQTDQVQVITLDSKIVQALWRSRPAVAGEKIELEVWTRFVGNGSKISIKVQDKSSKKVGKIKGEVYGNYFAGSIIVPEKAKEWIVFTAKLPRHGLEMKSNIAQVIPPISVKNQKWGQDVARRGDIVKLSADIEAAYDEIEAIILIYEHDQDGAHDFIAKFPTIIKNKKIDAEWEYEYHEDTDDIPTEEEMKKVDRTYNSPEYFWVVEVGSKKFGDKQESGLLKFKDWLEIELKDEMEYPIGGKEYVLHLPDGTQKKGSLDKNGFAEVKDIPPGKTNIEFVNK